MPPRAPFYITTPIYYVNDKPHIGHAYTTTICDIAARFMRFLGRDVFFLTGTDEHGVKVEKSANERGVTPLALADENAAEFQRVLGVFGVTNDDFIRTTQPRHIRQVEAFVRRLLATGDVYLGEYEGWYDEGQEEFVTETRAAEQQFKSAISGRALVRMKEKNYYFRLSAYQTRLEALYADQPGFVRPEARRNEMLGRLRDGLQDVPVSRTSFSWGIPIPSDPTNPARPGDPAHVIWVWLDALSNYITALGLAEPESDVHSQRAHYWPADYHVVGKEILFFHALFWPAMLMALGLPVPKCVYAHSFWISEGQKMSKSLGNFIDLPTIARYHATYSLDAWRFYMATQGPLGAQDADFAASHFHSVYSTDLVNTVGNCTSRVTAMIGKYFEGRVPEDSGIRGQGSVQSQSRDREGAGGTQPSAHSPRPIAHSPQAGGADVPPVFFSLPGFDLPASAASAVETAIAATERLDLTASIGAAMTLIRTVDAFINATEPFKVAKDPARRDELASILYQCAETLRIASLLLWCVMPSKMEQFWRAMGQSIDPSTADLKSLARWGGLTPGSKIEKVALFPRVEMSAEAVTP